MCAYVTANILDCRKDDYIQGFDVTSEGFEGCKDDEDRALNAARGLILEFLRSRVSDLGAGKDFEDFEDFEVLFRRMCGVIGLVSLWLAFIPFRIHRGRPLCAAGRASEDADAEKAVEEAFRKMRRERHRQRREAREAAVREAAVREAAVRAAAAAAAAAATGV
jgi:hypothetical protein